jgi:hypothetical protein
MVHFFRFDQVEQCPLGASHQARVLPMASSLAISNGDLYSRRKDLFVLSGARVSKADPRLCFVLPFMP